MNGWTAHAVEMGIDKTAAAFLLSIEGAISTAGKIFVGYICDHFKVQLIHNMKYLSFVTIALNRLTCWS